MNPPKLTVNQLILQLEELKKQGYGGAQIITPIDDECNDYRKIYISASHIDNNTLEDIEYVNSSLAQEVKENKKGFIILG